MRRGLKRIEVRQIDKLGLVRLTRSVRRGLKLSDAWRDEPAAVCSPHAQREARIETFESLDERLHLICSPHAQREARIETG